jgi:hypothetical protein
LPAVEIDPLCVVDLIYVSCPDMVEHVLYIFKIMGLALIEAEHFAGPALSPFPVGFRQGRGCVFVPGSPAPLDMIKDYELRIGRQIDIGIRFVLGAGGGEVFYPLARLVSYVTGYKVVPAEGGYKVKEICLVKVLYVSLKNLFRLPRYVGITVRKGRPLAFQKNSARFMVKGAKNPARIGSDFKARFFHTP